MLCYEVLQLRPQGIRTREPANSLPPRIPDVQPMYPTLYRKADHTCHMHTHVTLSLLLSGITEWTQDDVQRQTCLKGQALPLGQSSRPSPLAAAMLMWQLTPGLRVGPEAWPMSPDVPSHAAQAASAETASAEVTPAPCTLKSPQKKPEILAYTYSNTSNGISERLAWQDTCMTSSAQTRQIVSVLIDELPREAVASP